MGRGDIRVVGQGGDGGTVDIGMACLSGMFERNDDVLYICYDNQAYMNTGVQRSGATPPAARTATTPAAGPEPGNTFGQGKNVPLIAMAHESSPADTIKVARLAVESALFPVFEAEAGEVVSATPVRHQVPVTDYLRLQARYAHLFRPEERTDVLARIQASADRNVSRFGLLQDHPERTRPALNGHPSPEGR
ncbi:MAG TPA: thiamine pyrophosphate-dependent enzyme [Trebonia sp.]|nr:thiamine pyrophosphate-dependent enzyme [Trebonia sp.]